MTREQSLAMFGVPNIQHWFYDICLSHPYREGGRLQMAFFLLSDVQETIAWGDKEAARQALNRVKYVLDSGHEIEHRIVASLIEHLANNGFDIIGVSDEEERYSVTDPAEAMGHIFDVEIANLHVESTHSGTHREQTIVLIPGNGEDIISDHTYSVPDADGFENIMDTFEPPEAI